MSDTAQDPEGEQLTMIVFKVIDDPHGPANNGYQRPEALRLRQLLKYALRQQGLRCERCGPYRPEKEKPATEAKAGQ